MDTVVRLEGESLAEYAARAASTYSKHRKFEERKARGQFFTPETVATFMATLVDIRQPEIKVLDPGAGTGVLIAALCDVMKSRYLDNLKIVIDAYENDLNLLPLLETVLQECQREMRSCGYEVEYHIHAQDFILHNAKYFSPSTVPLWNKEKDSEYDVVIANPPYYKISKQSSYAGAMRKLIYGQPNIYALFMALAINLLRGGGEGIFITPRSFCSGLYYRNFREWFLANAAIDSVHLFESRRDVFDQDGVLQENIILKITKGTIQKRTISISVSRDRSFGDLRRLNASAQDVIYRRDAEVFIRIPSSSLDADILRIVDRWTNTLSDLDCRVSTGPVVPFRARRHLRKTVNGLEEIPLLWMHNIQGWDVVWPLSKNGKEASIALNEQSKSLVVPVDNYVLIKRFSAKEQKRRLYAGVLLRASLERYEYVGIENHVNYIHRPNGSLSEPEAFGIAAVLNTTLVDRYFRILNGNTQVNATDLRNIPFPSLEEIREIGTMVQRYRPRIGYKLDQIVGKILGWDPELIQRLNSSKGCYEQD